MRGVICLWWTIIIIVSLAGAEKECQLDEGNGGLDRIGERAGEALDWITLRNKWLLSRGEWIAASEGQIGGQTWPSHRPGDEPTVVRTA